MGRLEADGIRQGAMNLLGNGLHDACHHGDALTVREAELSTERRLGATEDSMLVMQNNLAMTYRALGRHEEALRLRRDVYFGYLKIYGEEAEGTLRAANNYASHLIDLRRFKEAKVVLRKSIPVARRVLGEGGGLTLKMRWIYAEALWLDHDVTLDDLREAVTTLGEAQRIARRVLGGAHPTTTGIENELRCARAALSAGETPPPSSPSGDA